MRKPPRLTLAALLSLAATRHDDALAFLEIAASDLRDAAIGDARGDFARRRFAVHQHVDRALHGLAPALLAIAAAAASRPAPPAAALARAATTGIRRLARAPRLPRNAFGTKAQRRVRNGQHIAAAIGHHAHRGRHPGLELELIVGDVDDCVVGDHVLHHLRRIADVADRAAKRFAGIGIDGEGHAHARLEPADVGLGHVGVHFHLSQVLRDGEDHRRLQRRRHGLPHVHRARDHHAIGGRDDVGVAQVGARLVELRQRLGELAPGLFHRGAAERAVATALSRSVSEISRCCEDFGGAPGLALGIFGGHLQARDIGARRRHIGLGLRHRGLEQRRIDLGDPLALLHLGIEIGVQLLDAAGNLAADIDGDHRLQAARRADARHDVGFLRDGGLVVRRGVFTGRIPVEHEQNDE